MCTTIVETGLDISNANTLIVERADTFGLSQLHQLRAGSPAAAKRGYAYFLYPREMPLTDTAHDRLATIAQNNELGVGMAVALKDLEIRGAGNVLGVEQSGHVAGVGFDLYVRLVGEAVEAYRAAADGRRSRRPTNPGRSPDRSSGRRAPAAGLHRQRQAATRGLSAPGRGGRRGHVARVVDELIDRYGPLPEPAQLLVAVARLRLVCRHYGSRRWAPPEPVPPQRLRLSPLVLADSAQLRLKRVYPGSNYRATTSMVQVPIPRTGMARRESATWNWCRW